MSITYPNNPNNDVVRTSYNLNCQTVTDEAGRKHSSCSDALGRLTCVIEDPGGVTGGFTTTYTYDALGDLKSVNQFGSNQPCGTTSGASRTRSFLYDSLSRLVSASNPESGFINYTYDARGDVITKADACNTITYTYDQLGRLTGRSSPGSSSCAHSPVSETYVYDQLCSGLSGPSVGLRTQMADASGTTCWAYDNMKRAVTVQRTVNTGQTNPGTGQPPSFAINYSYNYDGSVNQITYPSGRQLNYTLASNGNLTAGRDGMLWRVDATSGTPSTYVSGAHYAPDGQIVQAALGQCGGGGYFSYDQRLRPLHLLYTTNAASAPGEVQSQSCTTNAGDLMHRLYTYSGGDVQREANCTNNDYSQNFLYDGLDRISAMWTDGTTDGWSEQYTIDPWGNLTNIGPYNSNTYYEGFNEPAAVNNQLSLGAGYYDPVGNQIRSVNGVDGFNYDADNRIVSADAGSITYTCDGDGNRMIKDVGGAVTVYWRGPDGNTLAESDPTGYLTAEYLFFDGKRLARVDNPASTSTSTTPPAPTLEFYLSDHLGSTGMVTDSAMLNIVEVTDYYPFGGIAAQAGADPNHYKFTGKERDTETNNDYFGARYYASTMARFMSPDWSGRPAAVPYAQFGNPQSLNLYGYVRNNPLYRADLDGHGWWDDFKTAAKNTINNIGVGFLTLALQPDQAVKNIGQSLSTAAKAYGTQQGRQQLAKGVTPEIVMESLMTATASVAPSVAGAASTGGASVQSVGTIPDATTGAAVDASTPVGRLGSAMNTTGNNAPETINGIDYSGHALDRMQSNGLTPSVVEDTIQNGVPGPGNKPGTATLTTDQLKVVINSDNKVVTVTPQ